MNKVDFSWHDKQYEEIIEGDIELSQLTPMEVRIAMNKAVGRLAYYGSVLSDAKRTSHALETDFAIWEAAKYLAVDQAEGKKTEGYKKAKLMLDHADEYKSWKAKERKLDYVISQLKVLIGAFEQQIRVLMTISAMLRSEMETSLLGNKTDAAGARDLQEF